DIVMAQLADMDQPFALGANVDECTVALQPRHLARVMLTLFQVTPFHSDWLDHADHNLVLLRINRFDPDLNLIDDVDNIGDAVDATVAQFGDVNQGAGFKTNIDKSAVQFEALYSSTQLHFALQVVNAANFSNFFLRPSSANIPRFFAPNFTPHINT